MKDVESFIRAAPKSVQPKLRAVRAAIKKAAPDAVETISYGMPFYSFPRESGFQARLCYFGLLKQAVVFYTRPVFLEDYRDEIGPYVSTKSSLHFPSDRPIPLALIQKLVRNGVRKHRAGGAG